MLRRKFLIFSLLLFVIACAVCAATFFAVMSVRTAEHFEPSATPVRTEANSNTAATPPVPAPLSPSAAQSACPVQTVKAIVNGTSLSGFISPGQTVTFLAGYYDCHEPARDDVAIYRYGTVAADDLLIKIIKGIPGDAVSLQKAGGSWNILVNGEPLRTTVGILYAIAGKTFDTFSRYVNDASGTVPQGEYLILGNLPAGSRDSTQFGFVPKADLIGKVISE